MLVLDLSVRTQETHWMTLGKRQQRPPELYEVISENWAKRPLEYLATAHLAIVSRFEESFRYVSLRRENAAAFSYEFASIPRDAGSALGSFSDAIVRDSDPRKNWNKDPNIGDFYMFFSQYADDLAKAYIDVTVVSDPRRLQAFWGWTRRQAPAWWKAHNDVKHSEYKHAEKGNLQNATTAVAAVEIILRRATLNQRGTKLFSPWGGPWEPGEPGT